MSDTVTIERLEYNLRNAYLFIEDLKKTIRIIREDAQCTDSVQILDCAMCERPTLFGGSEPNSDRDANYFVCRASGCQNIYCRMCIARDFVLWINHEAREGWCHIHRKKRTD